MEISQSLTARASVSNRGMHALCYVRIPFIFGLDFDDPFCFVCTDLQWLKLPFKRKKFIFEGKGKRNYKSKVIFVNIF